MRIAPLKSKTQKLLEVTRRNKEIEKLKNREVQNLRNEGLRT